MICPGFVQPPSPRPRRRLVCTVVGSWRPVVVKGGKR